VIFVIGNQINVDANVAFIPSKVYNSFAEAYFFLTISADVLITFSMAFFLSRIKTGLPNTDTILSRIIVMTIQTGLLTTAVASAAVGLWLVYPDTSLPALAAFPLPKLYTISLLSSLNMRSSRLHPCNLELWASASSGGQDARSRSQPTHINVTTETIEFRSYDEVEVESKFDTREDIIPVPPSAASSSGSDSMQQQQQDVEKHC